MALLIAPYNNAMRIGQGFNSYTQQICIDDAVVVDPERLANTLTNDGLTMDDLRASMLGAVEKQGTAAEPMLSVKRGPSQIVAYSSRFVDKLSEITDDMNISGSLSIKSGTIGGSGRGSFINSDKFKESDLNFYISVKVINQTINIKDALSYKSLPSVTEENFTSVYGDSFLSGFLEGGEFNALVSMKILNSARKTDISAGAKVAFSVGMGDIEADGNVQTAKENVSNNTEMTIQVSWSGGGNIKPLNEPWTIESLRAVAAKFPELVSTTPQRTYAILTKYETLRSFMALKPKKLSPIYYENATIYTNALLDAYMDYKNMHRRLSTEFSDVQSGIKRYTPVKETTADSTTLSRIDDKRKFDASFQGVDLAKRACMVQMMKIAKEVDEITENPTLATDETRKETFQSSLEFINRLPKVEATKQDPVNPLTAEKFTAGKATKTYPSVYEGGDTTSLNVDEKGKVSDLSTERPSLGANLRLGALTGSELGDLFCCVDFLKPDFSLTKVRVEITSGVVSALHMQYSNGLVIHLGSDAAGDQTFQLDVHLDQNEKVIACSIEVGQIASEKGQVRVTALRLYTNRGPSLIGQADDWEPAVDGKATRGGVQFDELTLSHFDPVLEKGHLKGFWGRSKNSSRQNSQAGLYRLGPVWGNLESRSSSVPSSNLEEETEFSVVPAGMWMSTDVHPVEAPTPETKAVVKYRAEFPGGPLPNIVLGIALIDSVGTANLRCTAYAEAVSPTDFSINIDSWSDSEILQAKLAWLSVPTNDSTKFQTGKVETRGQLIVRDIKFGKAFKKPPTVVVWLCGLEEEKDKGIRIGATSSDVTTTGFKMEVKSWNISILHWASASWVAFSEETGIVSGNYAINFGTDRTPKSGDGRVTFPDGKFSKPPRVVTAFNSFDLNCFVPGNFTRIRTDIEEVTTGGFKYSTSTWSDSELHHSTATWLALPSP